MCKDDVKGKDSQKKIDCTSLKLIAWNDWKKGIKKI